MLCIHEAPGFIPSTTKKNKQKPQNDIEACGGGCRGQPDLEIASQHLCQRKDGGL
jgi:hypothetical protein